MRVTLQPLFGAIPANADNLEIVGELLPRSETWANATVWPASGLVRRGDGALELEPLWMDENLRHCADYHSKWSWLPRRQRGDFFNLSLFWWRNFYHWHCDVLVRLHRAIPELPEEVKIILPPDVSNWQRRSLELLGVPVRRLVSFQGRRPWKVDRLYYRSPLTMTGDHQSQALRAMRDGIQRYLGAKTIRPGNRKIYLTRKGIHARGVVNESELRPLLAERGFDVIDGGTMNYDEQIKLFSEAGVVIGPHGAAFTNLLWAASGIRVLEIFEPGSVRRCYWSMCQALGHRYHCAVAEAVSNPGGEPHMRIPVSPFAAALDRLLLDAD